MGHRGRWSRVPSTCRQKSAKITTRLSRYSKSCSVHRALHSKIYSDQRLVENVCGINLYYNNLIFYEYLHVHSRHKCNKTVINISILFLVYLHKYYFLQEFGGDDSGDSSHWQDKPRFHLLHMSHSRKPYSSCNNIIMNKAWLSPPQMLRYSLFASALSMMSQSHSCPWSLTIHQGAGLTPCRNKHPPVIHRKCCHIGFHSESHTAWRAQLKVDTPTGVHRKTWTGSLLAVGSLCPRNNAWCVSFASKSQVFPPTPSDPANTKIYFFRWLLTADI